MDSCPSRREFPESGVVARTAVAVLWLAGSSLLAGAELSQKPARGPEWSHVITVDERNTVGSVLQLVFHQVAPTGLGGNATAQLLKRVGDYLDAEVAQRGHATLSIGLLVDSALAAKAAHWSPEDMSRLAIALQRERDRDQHDLPRLARVIERVSQGSSAEQILGDGGTLKQTDRGRGERPIAMR